MELKELVGNGRSIAVRCDSSDEIIAFAYYADSQGCEWCTEVKFVDKNGLTKPTSAMCATFKTVAFFIYRPERHGFVRMASGGTPHDIDIWLCASDFISVPDYVELLDLL